LSVERRPSGRSVNTWWFGSSYWKLIVLVSFATWQNKGDLSKQIGCRQDKPTP
jgi:hypothetical protein